MRHFIHRPGHITDDIESLLARLARCTAETAQRLGQLEMAGDAGQRRLDRQRVALLSGGGWRSIWFSMEHDGPVPMASRILAVLAASLLIGAFALVTLAPLDMTLADSLYEIDPTVLLRLQHAVMSHLGRSIWQILAVPLLVRPTWLVPTALGLVCAGAAVTIATPPSARTRHRRS